MTGIQEQTASREQTKTKQRVIDCDIHNDIASFSEILEYMSEEMKEFARMGRVTDRPKFTNSYVITCSGGMRMDSYPAPGVTPGSSRELLKKQLLDEYEMDYGILNPQGTFMFSSFPQDEWATAVASAYNDWLIDKWLSYDPRFRGTVAIAAQDPAAAAKEIDRVGSHPQMVQVGLGIHSPYRGYGDKFYDPIWEAAVRNQLVVSFHVSIPSGLYDKPPTNLPKSYIENQTLFGLTYQPQMTSLIFNGVFEKFPALKVAFVEGGFAWVPSLMFTMDMNWASLRREVPWVKRPPSEYVKEHFWFGTQPMIHASPKHMMQLIDMIGTDRLIYCSDYPHWDFDSPMTALNKLPKEVQQKILFDNAGELFGLS